MAELANSSFDQDKRKLADYDGDAGSSSAGTSRSGCYNDKTGEYLYVPRKIHDSSLLWDSPGLGYRPAGGLGYQSIKGETLGESVYSSLIWFRHGGDGNYEKLKQNIDEYLYRYKPGKIGNQGSSLTSCDFEKQAKKEDEICEFNIESLSHKGQDIKCISAEHYGYYFGKPCVLLKMNLVYDWIPDPYTIEEVRNHTTMPKLLKDDIERIYADKCDGKEGSWGEYGNGEPKPCPYLNMVWLNCDGQDDPDKENIGEVTYTPHRGFPGYFFPYRNQIGYLSPLVMVQLKNPNPGVIMNIQCKAWARNIRHSANRKGMVHFEFLMD